MHRAYIWRGKTFRNIDYCTKCNSNAQIAITTEDFTDVKLAEQLKKSERQVQKMREISKKADEQTLDKVASGELTINQAYSVVKEFKHLKNNKTYEKSSIVKAEFIKGVKFALDELAKGKTAEEILASL